MQNLKFGTVRLKNVLGCSDNSKRAWKPFGEYNEHLPEHYCKGGKYSNILDYVVFLSAFVAHHYKICLYSRLLLQMLLPDCRQTAKHNNPPLSRIALIGIQQKCEMCNI